MSGIKIGESRVGYLLDQQGNLIGGSAHLKRDERRVTVELVWDVQHVSTLTSWFMDDFGGIMSIPKDNPVIPPFLKFQSAEGVLSLIGCRFGGGGMTSSMDGFMNAKISVDYAVHQNDDFTSPHIFKSHIESLDVWFSTSLGYSYRFPVTDDKHVLLHRPNNIQLHHADPMSMGSYGGFELKMQSTPLFRDDRKGSISATRDVQFITETPFGDKWYSHHRVHLGMRNLISLSAFSRRDFFDYHGAAVADGVIRQVTTSVNSIKAIPDRSLDNDSFMFTHADISPGGIATWLGLKDSYGPSMNALVSLTMDSIHAPVETRCLLAGVALELLGAELEKETGQSTTTVKSCANDECRSTYERGSSFAGKALTVADGLPDIGVDLKKWASSMANSYNGLKHKRKIAVDPIQRAEDTDIAVSLLRTWVAKRLGVEDAVVKKHFAQNRVHGNYSARTQI